MPPTAVCQFSMLVFYNLKLFKVGKAWTNAAKHRMVRECNRSNLSATGSVDSLTYKINEKQFTPGGPRSIGWIPGALGRMAGGNGCLKVLSLTWTRLFGSIPSCWFIIGCCWGSIWPGWPSARSCGQMRLFWPGTNCSSSSFLNCCRCSRSRNCRLISGLAWLVCMPEDESSDMGRGVPGACAYGSTGLGVPGAWAYGSSERTIGGWRCCVGSGLMGATNTCFCGCGRGVPSKNNQILFNF